MNKYKRICKLGDGETAIVWHAIDVVDSTIEVALKNFADDTLDEFDNEVKVLKLLKEVDCVVTILDNYEATIVLEYIKGMTVSSMFVSNQYVSYTHEFTPAPYKNDLPLMLKVWTRILQSLGDIHRFGISHGDFHTGNMIWTGAEIKIIDFCGAIINSQKKYFEFDLRILGMELASALNWDIHNSVIWRTLKSKAKLYGRKNESQWQLSYPINNSNVYPTEAKLLTRLCNHLLVSEVFGYTSNELLKLLQN
jgi:tRNA A-37 threonylcarbamoyl transferase component Bud32